MKVVQFNRPFLPVADLQLEDVTGKLVGCFGSPPNEASRVKQPVDTVQHVFVLYKLAPVGLFDACLNSCDESGLIFEHAATMSFTSCSASLPLAEVLCWSRVSTSDEKCTSMPFNIRENRRGGNGAGLFAGRLKFYHL
jgi:hypothetical protein